MRTERQQEILDAAVELVAREGFSRLTIRKVAASVGVSEPAVYRHFPHKLALLEEILEDLQAGVQPHFRNLAKAGADPGELFSEFIKGLFSEIKAKPAFASLVFSEEAFHSEPQLRPRLFRMMRENLAVLAAAFGSLQREGVLREDISPERIAMLVMGSIRLTITRTHMSDGAIRLFDQADDLAGTFVLLFGV